ncbi:MAG: CoA transferase, partial [Alphaproteobacteria bacterium]|nr:CoA transferase [Alphaproteobacteria bacterium]
SIEPQFYNELCARVGLAEDPEFDGQMNAAQWPQLKDKLAAIFRQKTRDEWDAMLEHTDVCYAPVLSMAEAQAHPHMRAREAFVDVGGDPQPAPAPRYSQTGTARPAPAPDSGADTMAILADLGMNEREIAQLREDGTIA